MQANGGAADIVKKTVRAGTSGSTLFDGVTIVMPGKPEEGFQVRDVAANSDFVRFIDAKALGLEIGSKLTKRSGVVFIEAELRNTTGQDRAITLVYAVPVEEGGGWRWLADARTAVDAKAADEYVNANRIAGVANERLSKYPFGAVARNEKGLAIGLDLEHPAFFRVGFNAGTGELFIAYDFGFVAENAAAKLRFCVFRFDAVWGFRGALAKYYEIFPDHFKCQIPEQGIWMPFAKISEVEGWKDFGFRFKEGNNETEWDDRNGILTFRYTEPHTWWMKMDKETPRTMPAALAEAKRLAEKGDVPARAFLTSAYYNERGQMSGRFLNRPWGNGIVWSMNSLPGLGGDITDFNYKWNAAIRERFYGAKRKGDLDGEYIDSSEGYVTDDLNFRRDHFAAAQCPLTFSRFSCKPAIFRRLIAYEYVRAFAKDMRAMGKFMMANSTPIYLCWLAPWLDVMGQEINWIKNRRWQPMSDELMLYRRSMCGPKPYCFLMNTSFENFSGVLVERYMTRCLAYGMFPGFFSADSATRQYFTRPECYNRDRPLFKKYIPICKKVAEAGWQPISLAKSSDPKVYVERFGDQYLTVLNDSEQQREVTVAIFGPAPKEGRDLVSGKAVSWHPSDASKKRDNDDVGAETKLVLKGQQVAVLTLK